MSASKDYNGWYETDSELYAVWCEMCENKLIVEMVTKINERSEKIRNGLASLGGRVEHSTRDHQEIVNAILAGDGTEAQRLMFDHSMSIYNDLHQIFTTFIMPFVSEGV